MNDECIFCKIVRGDFGTTFVAESEHAVAFEDIAPAAPVHILVVPRQHFSGLRDLLDPNIAASVLELARIVAQDRGLQETGYRVVTNDGAGAGQTVFHLHFHVLGGQALGSMV